MQVIDFACSYFSVVLILTDKVLKVAMHYKRRSKCFPYLCTQHGIPSFNEFWFLSKTFWSSLNCWLTSLIQSCNYATMSRRKLYATFFRCFQIQKSKKATSPPRPILHRSYLRVRCSLKGEANCVDASSNLNLILWCYCRVTSSNILKRYSVETSGRVVHRAVCMNLWSNYAILEFPYPQV